MARTFPTDGQSPIDAYTTGEVPASYFEFAGTIETGEEWHGNEIVAAPVLTSGSSFVAQNIVVTATGTSGSWVSGSYTKVVWDPATFVAGGYISAAEFELNVTGTAQSCDFGVLVLDGNQANTYAMQRGAYIMVNDFGATEITNLFRLTGFTVGTKSATSLWSTNVATTATHHLRIMIETTPYYIMLTNTAAT